jgi:hypothetical protein
VSPNLHKNQYFFFELGRAGTTMDISILIKKNKKQWHNCVASVERVLGKYLWIERASHRIISSHCTEEVILLSLCHHSHVRIVSYPHISNFYSSQILLFRNFLCLSFSTGSFDRSFYSSFNFNTNTVPLLNQPFHCCFMLIDFSF